MSIFARCLRSVAAVTHAKYELEIMQVTAVVVIRKIRENNGTEKISLVTPPQGKSFLHYIETGRVFFICAHCECAGGSWETHYLGDITGYRHQRIMAYSTGINCYIKPVFVCIVFIHRLWYLILLPFMWLPLKTCKANIAWWWCFKGERCHSSYQF